VPWLIEAQLRFDGPLNRLAAASANVGGGFHPGNVRQHLSFTDGPVSGTVPDGLPWFGAAWWFLLAVAVPLGRAFRSLVRLGPVRSGTVRPGSAALRERASAVGAAVGVAAASQYLLFTQVLEARFLLPTYAVLSVALVAAAPSPLRPGRASRRPAGRMAGALLLATFSALFTVFAGWQVIVADRVDRDQAVARELAQTLARAVRSRVTPPCVLAGEVAFPVIAFETGCQGAPFRPESPDITVAGLPPDSPLPPVYALTTTNPTRTGVHPMPASAQELSPYGAPGWWLFVATPNEVFAAS
jgi:hypothetical protein